MYQLVKLREDNKESRSKLNKSLRRLRIRLSKMRRGYIVDDEGELVCSRGFSIEMRGQLNG